MTDNRDKILSLVRLKGPCLPTDIYKQLETSHLFASAMLGELTSKGLLKVTNLKRGSSPYYYLEDQKDKLQDLNIYLNDKDKIAYNLLKEKKILRDQEQTPLMRVALRTIKDYAVPLTINYQGESIVFWKWYLMSNPEAEIEIKNILGISPKQKPIQETQKELPKEVIKEESKIVTQKVIEETPKKQEPIKKQPQEKIVAGQFYGYITSFFKKGNISIINQETSNNKKTEFDFIIEIPSSVGKLQYYCKAKSKKTINDSDIASAMIQGQQRKLPVLVLTTGNMTRKAKIMLEREFKGVTVQKI